MSGNDHRMSRADLERVREWVIEKLATGSEPPWSWYQHMKLREALDAILMGMDATQPMADSLGSASRRGGGLRLVGGVDSPSSARRHPETPAVPLPM